MILTIKGHEDIVLNDISMNGNNYVSNEEVNTSNWPSVFELVVTDDEGNVTEHFDHAKLVQQVTYDSDPGKWYLAFVQVSEQDFILMQQQSQIEYIAMMSDIDL